MADKSVEHYLSNFVGELGLCLAQYAWLRVVVALPGEVAGGAVAQPHKDAGHCIFHFVWAPLQPNSRHFDDITRCFVLFHCGIAVAYDV